MTRNAGSILAGPRPRLRGRRSAWALGGVFVLALLVRLPLMNQSLWDDEIATLRYEALQGVREIVAGTYSPNNHILYSLLAKASLKAGRVLGVKGVRAGEPGAGENDRAMFSEFMFRLPSLLAGSAVGVVIAWPLRRRRPWVAVALAMAISFHPWMITYSVEGRGYALALLLCALATNALPRGRRVIEWKYSLACAAALYAVPVSAVLILGHGVAMVVLRRRALWTWVRSAVFAVALAGALYLPLLHQMRQYARHPLEPTIPYREFIDQLPRFAAAGENLPNVRTALAHWEPDDLWIVSVAVIALGTVLAWRQKVARPVLLSFAAAVAIALAAPLVNRTAGEVRFVPWLVVLASMAVVGVLASAGRGPVGRVVLGLGMAVFVAWGVTRVVAFRHQPAQPLRDAMELVARVKAPGDRVVVVCYIAGKNTSWAYSRAVGDDSSWANSLRGEGGDEKHALADEEAKATGGVWVVVPYEKYMRRDTPELWEHLQREYWLYERLPGRVAPVGVYKKGR